MGVNLSTFMACPEVEALREYVHAYILQMMVIVIYQPTEINYNF